MKAFKCHKYTRIEKKISFLTKYSKGETFFFLQKNLLIHWLLNVWMYILLSLHMYTVFTQTVQSSLLFVHLKSGLVFTLYWFYFSLFRHCNSCLILTIEVKIKRFYITIIIQSRNISKFKWFKRVVTSMLYVFIPFHTLP